MCCWQLFAPPWLHPAVCTLILLFIQAARRRAAGASWEIRNNNPKPNTNPGAQEILRVDFTRAAPTGGTLLKPFLSATTPLATVPDLSLLYVQQGVVAEKHIMLQEWLTGACPLKLTIGECYTTIPPGVPPTPGPPNMALGKPHTDPHSHCAHALYTNNCPMYRMCAVQQLLLRHLTACSHHRLRQPHSMRPMPASGLANWQCGHLLAPRPLCILRPARWHLTLPYKWSLLLYHGPNQA